MNVTVRRRAGLMALVAVAAMVVAIGYLWRFSQTQSEVSLLLGVGLGLVAVAFVVAWGDARTPLLVADDTGLRVRLGRDWVGVPWGHVQRVEVGGRTRVRDGHVAVLTASSAASLEGASWRSRLAGTLNRWLYDAPFVVPYGPTTICSVVDVQQTLTKLAAGRAPVVDVDASRAEPQPTVVAHDPDEGHEPVDTDDAEQADGATQVEERPDEEVFGPEGDGGSVDEEQTVPLAGPNGLPAAAPFPRPEVTPGPMAARVVSALRSRPARREEVTVPFASGPATIGMLALSDPLRREHDADLDADGHLSSLAEEVAPQQTPDASAADRGNVALIIDATTDLSRRAMSKVRRPAPTQDETDEAEVEIDHADDPSEPRPALLIGDDLTRAREHLGLSIDDLAERTRIRPSVIEALEVDDFRPAGGDFYARGHLRMLARVLGIDADQLLTTYDQHFATNPVSPRQVFEVELASGTTGMVRGTTGGSRWGGLIAAVLVLMIVWGIAQYFLEDSSPAGENDGVPQNSAGLGSPGVGNPEPPAEQPEAHVKATAAGGDSWIVVRDGSKEEIFAGKLLDGQSRRFVGEAPLRLMAVDGGIISLRAKGNDLGTLGELGENRARTRVQAAEPASRSDAD